MRMPMMAMTTSSLTKVKPLRRVAMVECLFNLVFPEPVN